MPNLKAPEILLILLVVLLLFGAKRLPDLAKSVGKSLKILKTEVKDLDDDRPASGVNTSTSNPPSSNTNVPPSSAPSGSYPDPVTRVQPADDTERKQV